MDQYTFYMGTKILGRSTNLLVYKEIIGQYRTL
jgi:hypothetical protein